MYLDCGLAVSAWAMWSGWRGFASRLLWMTRQNPTIRQRAKVVDTQLRDYMRVIAIRDIENNDSEENCRTHSIHHWDIHLALLALPVPVPADCSGQSASWTVPLDCRVGTWSPYDGSARAPQLGHYIEFNTHASLHERLHYLV